MSSFLERRAATDHKKMVAELLDDESDRLNDWEIEFLESVNRRDSFTDRQKEKLEQLWDKVFG